MIDRLVVPEPIILATDAALRAAGADGLELFVLWTGHVILDSFTVVQRHVPKQHSYRSAEGCSVRVDAPALHELNVWLYQHGQTLGVQVHSHPSEAYHSDTDDTYPIVTTEGGVSLVVADFGRDGLRAATTVMYRLEHGYWQERQLQLDVV